jgi:hypothetical protein
MGAAREAGHGPDGIAKPGGKGLGLKNYKASVISWAGSADRSCNLAEGPILVGTTGRSPDRAAGGIGGPALPPGPGSPGRYFLSPRPLPPGHNSGIPEMSNSMSPPAEPGVYSNEFMMQIIRAFMPIDYI